jgi:hypothetical protein
MTTNNKFTVEQVEKMDRMHLIRAAKTVGIKTGKLSLMQIREALVKSDLSAADRKPAKKAVKVDYKPNVTNRKPEVVEKTKKVDGPRSGTKLSQCFDLYKSNQKLARKDIMALFIKDVKISKACANTYVSLCVGMLKKAAKK